jgi:hypothetical protein
MSLKYQSIVNFATKGSDGSISGKFTPSSISQEMKEMRINKQLK